MGNIVLFGRPFTSNTFSECEHKSHVVEIHISLHFIKLSRAIEVGSPTNPPWAPGSDKTLGQGSLTTYKNFKQKRTVHLTRFLLRQGEPGTSQYVDLAL